MSTESEGKYNQDELVAPSFVTEAFVLGFLQTVEDDLELHLINYDVKPGSSAGDHYASIMFKIITDYGTRGRIVTQRRFILKTLPVAEGEKKDFLDNSPAFKNEIRMYTKTLPAMEAILKDHGETSWWPKLVYSMENPYTLVFDDITMDLFRMSYEPLGFNGVALVVDKIAKFHAMSLVLLERGEKEILTYEAVMNESLKHMFAPMVCHMQSLAKEVQTWQGFEFIGQKLHDYAPQIPDRTIEFYNSDGLRGFHVLNHGDFHIKNLMFQIGCHGEPTDVRFLDFQMPNYNSPGLDLIGLLDTVCDSDMRKRRGEVIKMYHDKIAEYLQTYGYRGKIPTGIDIHIEMLRASHFDAYYSLLAIPLLKIRDMEMSELANTDNESVVVRGLKKVFRDPEFREETEPMLYTFFNRGIFD